MLLVSACSTAPPEDVERREALIAAVRDAAPGDTVDLVTVLGDDWDRAAFLDPYSTNRGAREILGFDFDYEGVSPWQYTEGGKVLVLAADDQLVGWMAMPSSDVGLHCVANLVTAEDASFTVLLEDDQWRSLVPVDSAYC